MLLALSVAAFAQKSIRVDAPNVVGADEQFNVTFVIEGENSPTDFQWKPGEDFQLVWGPQRGTSRSVRIINGKRTSSEQTTYTYVLMPRKTGKFTLSQATATVKGNTISSNTTVIEVVSNGASSSSSRQSQDSGSQGAASSGDIRPEDLFLRLSLSRTSVVVGETITATLKLYQRVNIAGFEDAKFPTFNGFWSQEVQAPKNIEFQRESLDDRIYNSAVLRSWTLIPQQSGDIKIDPAELVCLVNIRTASSPTNSIFDSFFQDDYRTIRKRVYSDGYTIHVQALPSGAPSSFGGGVGTFSMNASVTRNEMDAHDAASLIVTVSGKGNVSLLEAPEINFPPDFEVYDVKTSDAQGSKTFEYPFIPRSHGEFTIPAVEYSYYDINSRRYVTLTSESMDIKVNAAAGGNASASIPDAPVSAGVARKGVRDLGNDIRYIVTKKPSFSDSGSFFVGSGLFWLLLVLWFTCAASVYASSRSLAARRADVIGAKNRSANKMAQKRLALAGDFLKKDLHTAFYEELHKALLGYISDKLNIDIADMSKDNISETLKAQSVPDSVVDAFTALLDACEFARYAPDSGHDAMSAHYNSALEVISSIDSSMSRKKKNSSKGLAAIAVALLLIPGAARAAQNYPDSLWNAGVSAYTEGSWQAAAESWESISDLGVESSELYYNIGNAYFKMSDYAHAILYYERAHRLDPSNKDISHNLEFANEFVQDKIESVPELFLKAWSRKVCWSLSSDSWAIVFFVLLALALAGLLTFLLSSAVGKRKAGFFSSIVFAVLALVCLLNACWQRRDYSHNTEAIVTRAVTSVKSSPGSESSKDLFILHEGAKVKLIDEVGNWRNIELADGRQGWMLGTDMELI